MHEVMTMFVRTLASWSWGPDAEPAGPRREGAAPSGRWKCLGDGKRPEGAADYVFVTVASQALWHTFCSAVDMAELRDDDRFAQPADRRANSRELRELLRPWFAIQTKHEVMTRLGQAGVPVSAVFDTTEVFNDPHLNARNFFTTLDHPTKGELLVMNSPIRMSESEVPMARAPLVGEHTREVLAAELGLSQGDIDELIDKGAAADG